MELYYKEVLKSVSKNNVNNLIGRREYIYTYYIITLKIKIVSGYMNRFTGLIVHHMI